MFTKIITIMILSTGVMFSQIDSSLKYSEEQDGNEIDLIITQPVKLKNKNTGKLVTYNIEKKITGVSKIISMNDTSIYVWNGKLKIVELDKINAIRFEDPDKPNYILVGPLTGLGLGILTGFIVGNINTKSGGWIPDFEPVINGTLYGGLIGLCAGAIIGIIANIASDEYITIPFNKYTNEKKKQEIKKYVYY